MKQFSIAVILLSILFSCNSKQENMLINGKITGFQKGTIYLEKVQDTLMVKLDSVTLDAKSTFQLAANVDQPEMYFLTIENSNKQLSFFGEKGEIKITDKIEAFGYAPKISGSKNQEIMDMYQKTNRRFIDLNLDLLQEKFDIMTIKDEKTRIKKLRSIELKMISAQRRKYLYTINFAVNNAQYEVAPYLVLTEIPNANPKLLDTIVKSLSPKVAKSLYGKKLVELLKD